jgi:hypothetical protein
MPHAVFVGALAICSLAQATTIFSSGGPFGWPQGPTGTEVFAGRGCAVAFTPAHDCTLASCSLWIMSGAPAGEECAPTIVVTIRDDAAGPGEVIDSWTRGISAGSEPALEVFDSLDAPELRAGRRYWLVAEATTPSGRSPVWNRSHEVTGMVGVNSGGETAWSVGEAPALAAVVEGSFVGCGSRDFDGDGDSATDADIAAFLACLAGDCCASCDPLGADFDNDGDGATDADIEAFFRVLAGGPC